VRLKFQPAVRKWKWGRTWTQCPEMSLHGAPNVKEESSIEVTDWNVPVPEQPHSSIADEEPNKKIQLAKANSHQQIELIRREYRNIDRVFFFAHVL